ncbi:MAG: acyl-CoA thioesterase [Candidatus Heimdallarchaeota archaeon]|nr:acyl-CoA thioesterase [Candidatus Heimdallarchaeota archaeon]
MELPSSLYKLDLRLRFSDIDSAGIAYFGSFPSFFDESFIAAMRENNIRWDDHKKFKFLLPIIEQKTNFFHPLDLGDLASIYMGIIKIGNRSFRSQHLITVQKDGKDILVATGYISRVTVGFETFKAIQIPELLLNMLKKYNVNVELWNLIDQRLNVKL